MIKRFVSGALLSIVMDKEAREKLARIKAAESPDSGGSGAPPVRPGRSAPPADKASGGAGAGAKARAEAAEAAPGRGRAEDMPRNVRVRSPAEDNPGGPGGGEGGLLGLGNLGGEGGLLGLGSLGSLGGGGGGRDAEDPLSLIENAVAEARRSLGMDPPAGAPPGKAGTKKPELKKPEPPVRAAPKRAPAPPAAPPAKSRPPAVKGAAKGAVKGAAGKAAKGGGPRAPDPGAPGSARERLIADALSIHAEKSRLLDQLAPELKDKLRLMALKQLDPAAFEEIKRDALERHKKRTAR